MKCSNCKGKTVVTDSRQFPEFIRRRRVCSKCNYRTTTFEIEENTTFGKVMNLLKKGMTVEDVNVAVKLLKSVKRNLK